MLFENRINRLNLKTETIKRSRQQEQKEWNTLNSMSVDTEEQEKLFKEERNKLVKW